MPRAFLNKIVNILPCKKITENKSGAFFGSIVKPFIKKYVNKKYRFDYSVCVYSDMYYDMMYV